MSIDLENLISNSQTGFLSRGGFIDMIDDHLLKGLVYDEFQARAVELERFMV